MSLQIIKNGQEGRGVKDGGDGRGRKETTGSGKENISIRKNKPGKEEIEKVKEG